MAVDVPRELHKLEGKTLSELRSRYAELFGETTKSRHRQSLIRRIVWRMQALEEGDLSERARRRAAELADEADLRLTPPRSADDAGAKATGHVPRAGQRGRAIPAPGTVLTRLYKGRLLEVTVLAVGFAYEGRRFATLSAVAKYVTGSHWNGHHFFGLRPSGRPSKNGRAQ